MAADCGLFSGFRATMARWWRVITSVLCEPLASSIDDAAGSHFIMVAIARADHL